MSNSTVRAHLRGLEVLQALNTLNFASVLDINRITGLPRATIYRLLATLVEAGYVAKLGDGQHYSLSSKVLTLTSGYDDRARAIEVARPIVNRFCDEIGWPVYLYAFDQGTMQAQHVVHSPKALQSPKLGSRVPILRSSPGRAFLHSLDEDSRQALVEKLLTDNENSKDGITDSRQVELIIRDISYMGCGFRDQGLVPRTCSFAVPIHVDSVPAAFMTIVVMRSVMSVRRLVDNYLSATQEVVKEVEKSVKELSVSAWTECPV